MTWRLELMTNDFATRETGSWRTERPEVLAEKCNLCRRCVDFCPDGVMDQRASDEGPQADLVFCKGCGICAQVCNLGAISMVEEK